MPTVQLPGGYSAVLTDSAEVSQGTDQAIQQAFMLAAGAASKLEEAGFDAANMATWKAMREVQPGEITQYEGALITGLVESCDHPKFDPADPATLPKAVFAALAAACLEEYNKGPDFSPDALATDPKAPPAASAD